MRIENKPKSISKNKTLVGAFFSSAGAYINGTIKKYFGIDIGLDTTNFDKNLDNTIVDVQKLADAVDELVLGNSLPAGTENQTLRKGATDWEANDNLQIFTDRTQNTVPFAICDIAENPTDLYPETQFLQKKFNDDVYLGHELVDFITAIRIIDAIDYGILMFGDTEHFVYISTNTDTEVVMDITYDGKWNGFKYYKKSISGVENQFNNIVVDKDGNYEKELKNIAVLEESVLIESDSLTIVPNLSVRPMRGNIYHLEFRFILKRLIQVIPYDTFAASGFQFQFTNAGVNELEFLGGIDFSILLYSINSKVADYAQSYSNEFHNPISDYIYDVDLENINTDATVDMVVIHGTGMFKQSPENETINDNLSVLVAKVTDDEDYTLEKGSFVKITLKNEG